MATAPFTRALATTLPSADHTARGDDPWRAPLVPVALAATAGIVLDRYVGISLPLYLLLATAGLVAWFCTRNRPTPLPLACLGVTVLALGAAYHHSYREAHPTDDIGNFALPEPRPVHLRGVLEEEPPRPRGDLHTSYRSIPESLSVRTVLRVTQLEQDVDWVPASGRASLVVAGGLDDVHVGDEVDVVGQLIAPEGPANPGEPDEASALRDRRIRAEVRVRKTSEGAVRLAEGWRWSPAGWLALLKKRGQTTLGQYLPEHGGLAQALLLGRGASLTPADWDRYVRGGVVHVLVVSGLHVALLGWVLWRILWLLGVRRRHGAWAVALLVCGYALLTGAGMPIRRGAAAVCVACGGITLRRPPQFANSFALSWLVVALLNPTDLFSVGCRLSFLAVAVLAWGVGRRDDVEIDPLTKLIEDTRPAWQRGPLWLARAVGKAYLVTLAVWLAEAPLLAADVHVVSPVALLIGPPLMVLAAVALVFAFLLLVAGMVFPPLAQLLAWPTEWSLASCDGLVTQSVRIPGSYWYVADVPVWWLWAFYLGLLAYLMLESVRRRWCWALLAGLVWLCVGLLSGLPRGGSDELRCTFLAVGHGGCAVLETPDGRVLLYDAGALSGPEVTRRHIAPFLWSRGIRRIDEVLLSHADLDHFNGIPDLLERFTVGQVTCTPTFAEKPTPGVHGVLAEIDRRGIPRRVVRAGDFLTAGDVRLEVLHPPAEGVEGNENARSLVLVVRHAGHVLLLTGDLEGAGLQRVLRLPPIGVDVMQAPHHGSKVSNTPDLARWARPQVVISCQGPPPGGLRRPEPYTAGGARFIGTWPHGAVTVRSHRTGLVVETFRTGQLFAVRPGRPSSNAGPPEALP
jgi:competence protein ComEC